MELYIRQRASDGAAPPTRVLLDFDATDDPAHGEQEGAYYHGYYEERILHPLLVFDGETNQFITAVLRCGNTHTSRGALAILKRIVNKAREAWPHVKVEIQADAGFAVPEIYEYCEAEGIDYTIGLITNPRLKALAEPLLERAIRESEEQAGAKVRLLSEGWIKDFKLHLKAERLSCHRFMANQLRILLHAVAYWLMDAFCEGSWWPRELGECSSARSGYGS